MHFPRFYPILDIPTLEHRGFPAADAAAALLDSGARVMQLRHKGTFTRAVLAEAEKVARLCRDANALLIVDDRADIALLLDAGLHLGQDDLPPVDARRLLGLHRRIGYSTHNAAQLQAALDEPVDYLAVGPIFRTGSKENPDPMVGLETLASLRALTRKPLIAIGGITRDNAHAVYEAGADSIAVIGALYAEPCTAATIRDRAAAWVKL